MRRLLVALVALCVWAGGVQAQGGAPAAPTFGGQAGPAATSPAQPAAPLLLSQSAAASVRATWQANPAGDGTILYRLYYGLATKTYTATVDVPIPGTSVTVAGLTRGQTYYFAIQARAATLSSALSTEIAITIPAADPACAAVTGADAIAIFPTALQHTGSGGAGSQARLDFQIGSPGSPVTSVAVQTGTTVLGQMAGQSLNALAGVWFPMPIASGSYPLSVTATNAYGCTRTQSTAFVLTIP